MQNKHEIKKKTCHTNSLEMLTRELILNKLYSKCFKLKQVMFILNNKLQI